MINQNQIHTATYDDEEARQYLCKKCGCILITNNHTGAPKCSFCGSQTSLGSSVSGEYCPVLTIPFSISSKKAQKAFRKWCRKLSLSPKDFSHKYHIKKVQGIFLPAWVYQLETHNSASLLCQKTETKQENDEKITETKQYNATRKADIQINYLPVNASDKISDSLFDKICPYDFTEAVDFNPRQLDNHFSEKIHILQRDAYTKAKKKSGEIIDNYFAASVSQYDSFTFTNRDYTQEAQSCFYTLLPVWLVYYQSEQDDYIFALNGQTGKIASNPPVSHPKIAIAFGVILAFSFLLLRIITVLLGGSLL